MEDLMSSRVNDTDPSGGVQHCIEIIHEPAGRRQRSFLPVSERIVLGRRTGRANLDRGKLLVEIDTSVSRFQAWLEVCGGELVVDRHEKAGTRLILNNETLDRFRIRPGGVFHVGHTTIRYQIGTDCRHLAIHARQAACVAR